MTAAVEPAGSEDPEALAAAAIELAGDWLSRAAQDTQRSEARTSRLIQGLVEDPAGVAFTMRFVDRVIRPADDAVAADALGKVVGAWGELPRFLGTVDRVLLWTGARMARRLPSVVMPLARRRLRRIVGHLVVDADPSAMARHLGKRRAQGFDLNVNLLGEAVLGHDEADRRLTRTTELLAAAHVDYVSVKVSGIAAQLEHWAHDRAVERVTERLRVVFRSAGAGGRFVNLDMEEYRDLELTLDAFRAVLDEDEFLSTSAGVVIQAYLPDALGALAELTEWAVHRRQRGGAQIKIRLVKGANLAMERVDAAVHGWEQAPYPTKAETDANYLRCLDWLLRPEHTEAVRVGVGSHNLFDLAWAWLLADSRRVGHHLVVEMLEGMAPAQSRVILEDTGSVLLYTPVVHAADFDVAVAYLFRRLEENTASGNFLRVAGRLAHDVEAFEAEATRFRQALADRHTVSTTPRRGVERAVPSTAAGVAPFANEPESDPTAAATRAWATACVARTPEGPRTPLTTDVDVVNEAFARAKVAQGIWSSLTPAERRTRLAAVASELGGRRGDLLSAMVHEGGKTVGQADPEICEAIDFVRYYADSALALTADHARFEPLGVVVVAPPWNFPVAIPTGGMFAGLAAGNAVICKPAPEVPRCTELVVEAAHAAGLPTDLLQVVRASEDEVGRQLVTAADGVVLTGGTETARLFRSWNPRMKLFAETSGKNAVVVTPRADLDLAVRDLVSSAFGHAGQKCSAASLAICVGDVYEDPRFRRQLTDAVESLAVGAAHDLATDVGPLIGRPNPRLARAFTELDPGEEWLVEPRSLGGDKWRPGVRIGVQAGSWFHRTECFGPVLGLMAARDLDEALHHQNATGFGLTGGIHSLDPGEVDRWVDRVEVGNAYVNRGITGAIVRRQPFGGWKASSVGPGAKAGGPNYVAQLGTWLPVGGLDPRRWETSDRQWWEREYGRAHDPTGLFCESNVFRYRPLPHSLVRVGPDTDGLALERIRHAATTCQVPLVESHHTTESDEAFAARLATLAPSAGARRVRLLGGTTEVVWRAAAEAGVHLADDPATNDARTELRHHLREQTVSRTLHRFGNLVSGAGGDRTHDPGIMSAVL